MLISTCVGCNNGEKNINIKILATSDMHGLMMPYDYALDSEVTTGSLAQMGTLINNLRTDDTILIDVGDISQGNYSELFIEENIHPMFQALNLLKYDVFTVGNHEFNYGVEYIQKQINGFNGVSLCGNVINKNTNKTLANPYTIITRNDVRVAIIGMVSPCIKQWDGDKLTNWDAISTVKATNAAIKEIQDNNSADIIIAAEHMGLGMEYEIEGTSVTEIAEKCPGLDLVIGAHEHTAVNKKINNVLVMENKSEAKTLVEVNIKVEGSKNNFKITNTEGKIHSLEDEKPEINKSLEDLFKEYDTKCKKECHTVIGNLTNGPMAREYDIKKVPSTFMEPTPLISIINEAQIYKTNKYLKDVKKITDKEIKVSCTSIGNYWANIKEVSKDIRKCDVSLIYKYSNTLYILEMNGKQLKQFLEYSARFINKCLPNHLTISFSNSIPLFQYDFFAGIDFKIDVSKDIGSKITDLKWSDSGNDVKDDDSFYIAANNYRANTQLLKDGVIYDTSKGDSLPKLIESDIYQGEYVRDIIKDYIESLENKTYDCNNAKFMNNWSYTGFPWKEEDRKKAIEKINNNEFDIGEYNSIPMTTDDL